MYRNTYRNPLCKCALFGSLLFFSPLAWSSAYLEVEGGLVWFSKNDVQIPNDDSGTRFDMLTLLGKGSNPYGRVQAGWQINDNNLLRFTAAPLQVDGTGTFSEPVNFEGQVYAADQPVKGTYRFSTYRLTYRYDFDGLNWRAGLGAALLVRDAKIQLEQGTTTASNTDLGFVPLLHGNVRLDIGAFSQLELDALGAAAPQGRAFDVAVRANRWLSDQWQASLGYRVLEGGADISELYNFALLQFATLSLRYSFR